MYYFFLIAFGILTARLFYWQIIQGSTLKAQATAQYFSEFTLPAQRGKLLAAGGEPMVVNQPAYLVYAQPGIISEPSILAELVAPYLKKPKEEILSLISEPGRLWAALGHKVEAEMVEKLKQLSVKGLGYEVEPKRFYPEASSAAHMLGFVAAGPDGDDRGYFGLEGFYDRELKGKNGVLQTERDARGKPILIGEPTRIEAQHGGNLYLWMDRALQWKVQNRLLDALQKYGASGGTVVVMDPKSGGILAAASYPAYEPGIYNLYDKEMYKNPLVAASFEPGSTFKTLIMAAGIEEGAVTPETEFDESGPVRVGEYAIRTWNDQYRGVINMTDVLVHSSNPGMVYVGKKLGRDKFLKYLHGFGFGELTGIDLQDETTPELRKDKDWKEIDITTASFGQGIAVTPIQMVRAVAAIANGGNLVEPRVVSAIENQSKGGKLAQLRTKIVRRVVSPKTAALVTEMMVAAVEQGEAKWAKPKGYRIAGKTGTAQIPVAGHYDAEKTIASFVGFAPADNPRFVALVILREPTSSPWGSETAAPLFFAIAKDIYLHYNIPAQ